MATFKGLIEGNRVKEGFEVVQNVLYDALNMVAGIQTLTFFQQVKGTAGISKTNMNQAGLLPAGTSFIVKAIRMAIYNINGNALFGTALPATTHPINFIIGTGSWKFKYEPSQLYEGHLTEFFEPISFFRDGTAAAGLAVSCLGGKLRDLILKTPIIIDSGRAFGVEVVLTCPADTVGGFSVTAATGTLLQCQLLGFLRRKK